VTTIAPNFSTRPATTPAAVPSTVSPTRGCDVLADLRGRTDRSGAPAVVPTLAWVVATAGIVPAVRWPLRFKQAAEADGRALRCLADWAAPRVPADEARDLQRLAARVQFAPALFTLGLAGAVVAALAVAFGLMHAGGSLSRFDRLMGLTFGFFLPKFRHVSAGHTDLVLSYAAWSGGLLVAYASHLIQVHLYAASARRFLDALNRVLLEEGGSPVYLRPIGWGFSPLWVATAAVLTAFGAIWGVALAVAGATDRRYRRKASPALRAALAEQVRTVVLTRPAHDARGPAVEPAPPVVQCVTPGCGRMIGPAARFCPRCGRRQG
jgi:hypothetical protein